MNLVVPLIKLIDRHELTCLRPALTPREDAALEFTKVYIHNLVHF